jgi:hypothetical protein
MTYPTWFKKFSDKYSTIIWRMPDAPLGVWFDPLKEFGIGTAPLLLGTFNIRLNWGWYCYWKILESQGE